MFLERLMKNVRKEASSKSFNLKRMKKIAAEPAIQMPPMPPAEAPVEAPVVLPEEISVDIPRDIRELIDQVIAKGPSPLPIFLFDNPEYINYFKDKINKQAGDPNSALFSLIEYQDATTNAYPGKKDKIIKSFGIQTMIGDPIQPQQEERVEEQHQVPDYDGDDLFNLVFNKILEDKRWWSKLKAGGYDEDSINEAVLNRLAPNIDSIDPRIMFFMNRPQYIDSPLKENLEQDKANGSVVTKQQFVDYVVQNGFASELYQKMREMINNDETFENDIIPWLKGVQKGSKLKQQYKPEISTATPLGGEGTGDLGSLLEDKGSRVRSQDTTMEDKELASKLNKNASVFVHGYLKKMFDQVRELVFKSIGDALSYASDARTLGDDKKAKNLEKFGQKMLFFIDSNVKQLENILSHESGNFRAKETSAGIRYGDQKNGFITLPRSEVENLIQYIYTTLKDTKYTEDTEDSEARTPDIDPDSPEVQQIIKQYLESGQSQWFPDLSNWIHDDVVNQRYKEVGQLKRLIKSYKTEGIKLDDQAKIIIDKANLYNLFPDKNDTLSFIKTTLTEDDDYIEKQWGKAGEGVRPAEAVGKKKAREGGGSPLQSKGELSTAVKHFLPYLYKNKVEGGYSSSILKGLFGIMPIHDYIKGAKNDGMPMNSNPHKNKDIEGLSNTELYYNLVGDEVPEILKVKQRLKSQNKKDELEKIKKDITLSDEEKSQKTEELKDKWDYFEKVLAPAAKEHYDNTKSVKKLKSRIDKLNDAIEDKKAEEKRKNKKVPSKFILNNQKKLIQLEEELAMQEAKMKYYEDLPGRQDIFANADIFKMAYSSFIIANTKIVKLKSLKNKYNQIKMASQASSIDNLIYKIMLDFNNKFGCLI